MEKLNDIQMEQLEWLEEATSREFASLMLIQTCFVSSEELDKIYSEAMELEGDFMHTSYDVNYYSVASDYAMLDKDLIVQAFGYYGEYSLYMDELGQGLVVGCY